MIGVDVIDRSCSFQLNRRHSFNDYVSKIINTSELDFCDSWQDLDMIWAMKESAYKCYYKKYGQAFLNPKKIRITHLDKARCIFQVEIDDHYFTGRYQVTSSYVYAICSDQHDFARDVEIFFLDQYSSAVQIQSEFNPEGKFQYHEKGFPVALKRAEAVYAYSRSHHGRYYFSAISLTPYN